MSVSGLCQICQSATAAERCERCGTLACHAHYDRSARACADCVSDHGTDSDGVHR